MAGKKKKSDLDALKAEVTSLSEAVWALRDRLAVQAAADAARESSGHAAGAPNGDAASSRISLPGNDTAIFAPADLLALDDSRAAQLLSALGHRQRLAIVRAILERPRSATELVDLLQLGTTGAAYHHLNVLQAVGIVGQEGRGIFTMDAQRVPGLLALLAAIDGMLDPGRVAGPADLARTGPGAEDGAG